LGVRGNTPPPAHKHVARTVKKKKKREKEPALGGRGKKNLTGGARQNKESSPRQTENGREGKSKPFREGGGGEPNATKKGKGRKRLEDNAKNGLAWEGGG